MMILHHGWRSSASRRVRLCLEEKGLSYQGHHVDMAKMEHHSRALMRNWIRHIDGLIGNLIIFNWRHHLQKTAQQWTDEELAEKLKNIPSKERQEAWLRVARKPYTEEERDAARAKLVTLLLDRMEDALKPSGWLVGGAYSIADIAAAPFVKRIDEEIAPHEVAANKHPRVAEWWAKIQARPAFVRANFGPFLES
jgi:glutathione S-transferase